MSRVRIVPAPSAGGLPNCQGTRVLLEDGSELEGVYKIVLTAEANSPWTAEIHCHPEWVERVEIPAVEVEALATIHGGRAGWWSRMWAKLRGGASRTYRKP